MLVLGGSAEGSRGEVVRASLNPPGRKATGRDEEGESKRAAYLLFRNRERKDFPGGPLVRTQHSQYRGPGSNPDQGTRSMCCN